MNKEIENKKIPKPVVLVILDGWGINQPYSGNAIALAEKPNIDQLILKYPTMALRASGEAVGLPWGEHGNSEVGHVNMGLGRIVYQSLPRINRAISDNSFYKNKVMLGAIEHAKKNNSQLHFMGVVSNGCVHASVDHLHALLVMAKENGIERVYVHGILDGRDTSYNSGVNFIKGVERSIAEYSIGKIATLSGRFYAMDRNNNWSRTSKAYDAMVNGKGNVCSNPIEAIETSYKKKIFDEEFVPTVVTKDGKPIATIKKNDAVIFYNFRPDRARQITKAFSLEEFDKFDRGPKLNNLFFATFTRYEEGLPVKVVFPPFDVKGCLGEAISKAGLLQMRIAETEKYAHVTYFFNGGIEEKFPGESHVLVPSPQVPSYDVKPEMSAPGVAKKVLEAIEEDKNDFILINFANADMIGHTANIDAAIQAIEKLDEIVGQLSKAILSHDGVLMITADHGNAEYMFNMQTGMKDKEHTSNPVPFILVGNEYEGKNFGWQNIPGSDLSLMQAQGILSDIAPTVLHILGLKQPDEMTGRSLI